MPPYHVSSDGKARTAGILRRKIPSTRCSREKNDKLARVSSSVSNPRHRIPQISLSLVTNFHTVHLHVITSCRNPPVSVAIVLSTDEPLGNEPCFVTGVKGTRYRCVSITFRYISYESIPNEETETKSFLNLNNYFPSKVSRIIHPYLCVRGLWITAIEASTVKGQWLLCTRNKYFPMLVR